MLHQNPIAVELAGPAATAAAKLGTHVHAKQELF